MSGNQMLSLAFTALILLIAIPFLEFRPQVVTILILLIEMLILEHVARENRRNLLFFLPILSWIEMQFHSTIWPSFFLVLFPYIIDFRLEDHRLILDGRRTVALCGTALACAGTLFLNPYGAWSVFYIFRSYGDAYMKASIGELFNTTFFYNGVWEIWFVLIILAFAVGNREKMPLRYYLLCFGFYVFAWTSVRNQIFFDFIGSVVLCYMLRGKHINLRWNLLPVIPAVAVSMALLYSINGTGNHNPQEESWETYVEALDRLASEYGVHGENIFCDNDAGCYAEYLGYHPYIDSRAEVFLKKVNGVEDSWHEYVRLQRGNIYYKDFLEDKDFSYLLVKPQTEHAFYDGLVHDDAYQILFEEGDYVIFAPVQR